MYDEGEPATPCIAYEALPGLSEVNYSSCEDFGVEKVVQ
jgi:hypothetical protein